MKTYIDWTILLIHFKIIVCLSKQHQQIWNNNNRNEGQKVISSAHLCLIRHASLYISWSRVDVMDSQLILYNIQHNFHFVTFCGKLFIFRTLNNLIALCFKFYRLFIVVAVVTAPHVLVMSCGMSCRQQM